MIKPRIPSGPPPKPLDGPELAKVLGWQRRMYWFYGIAMLLIFGGFLILTRVTEAAWVRPILALMLAGLMIGGAFVQFRERCPRCGTLLGRQSRFVLPGKCKSCGVPFPREGGGDHAPRA
jgi:hypothetical protein